jgi:hypothetical protein
MRLSPYFHRSNVVTVSINRFHRIGELAQVMPGPSDKSGFELSEAIQPFPSTAC